MRKDPVRARTRKVVHKWAPPARRQTRAWLLRWYDRHRRDLPWRRRETDAYAQLVAEFMLQQTQVATVAAYYERFMQQFPTVAALAAANLDDVLAVWSGLGYYRRARNLHAAAKRVVETHGGRVPATVEALMGLPGVGRYTAGAVASIAYDTRAAVLDGNVARVLMRLLGIEGDPTSPGVRSQLWAVAESLLPQKRCGAFNQALMELGATVCLPRGPDCPRCPLPASCRARIAGLTERIPAAARRVRVVPTAIVAAVVRQGRTLLLVQRPATGLWAGLWEVPTEPLQGSEAVSAARRRLRRRLPAGCRLATKPAGQVTRILTHRRVCFHVFVGAVPDRRGSGSLPELNGQPHRWVGPAEQAELGISRACEAVLELIGWPA